MAVALAAIAAIVLLLLLAPVGSTDPEVDTVTVGGHPLLGEPAPEIDLVSIDGEAMTLASLKGQPVIINFWATWCPPCRAEFPLLVDTYAEHSDDDLEILGILSKDFADGARQFASDMGADWPILEDPGDVAYNEYIVPGLPTSYFVDADGIVRAFSLGGFTEDGLAAQLATILPESVVPEASPPES